jgi:hypothetical protein
VYDNLFVVHFTFARPFQGKTYTCENENGGGEGIAKHFTYSVLPCKGLKFNDSFYAKM